MDGKKIGEVKLGARENEEKKLSLEKTECGELDDSELDQVSGGLLPPKPNPNNKR